MKTSFACIAALPMCLVCSCEPDPMTPPDSQETVVDNEYELPSVDDVFVCAVDFPEDYDWQRDTANGSVSAEILFYKNGAALLSLPSGDDNEISADPDMHHIMLGHLYSEYSTSSGTVIKKDGATVLRYDGRERLRGLAVSGGRTFTLGQNLSGGGFCFRADGKAIIRSQTGCVFGDYGDSSYPDGALYEDSGSLCFCYEEDGRYYSVRDTVVTEVSSASGYRTVYDMKMIDGVPCFVSSNRNSRPILVTGEKAVELSRILLMRRSLSLVRFGSDLYVTGTDAGMTCLWSSNQWDGDIFDGDFSMIPNGCGIAYVTKTARRITGARFVDDSYALDGEGSLLTPSCARACTKGLYLGITSSDRNKRPFLWQNGESEEYDVNGYIASVRVGP